MDEADGEPELWINWLLEALADGCCWACEPF